MLLSRVRAGLARSWQRHKVLLLVTWLATLVACLLAVRAGGLYYFLDFREPGTGHWAGLFTVFSALCFTWAGWSLLFVARRRHAREGWSPTTLGWTVGGLGGIVLGLDEIAMLHESMSRRLAALGVPKPPVGDHDLYVFAFYGLCALFVAWKAWPDLIRWDDAWLPGAATIVLFAVSGVADAMPWDDLTRDQQRLWGPVEEVTKTLGAVNLAVFGMLVAEASFRDRDGG